jgi:hypothetical protein
MSPGTRVPAKHRPGSGRPRAPGFSLPLLLAAWLVLGACAATPPAATGVAPTAAGGSGAAAADPASTIGIGELRRESQRSAAREAEEARRGGVGLAASRPVAVAAVLAADEEPVGDDGAFALVLTERGPRAEALCTAMLERMDLTAMQQGSRARFSRRPVYWMLTTHGQQLDAIRDLSCPELVAQLDVQRAQAVGLGAEVGPVLVAEARRGADVWTMRWDLSDLPASEFPRATRIWAELLTGDPAGWEARAGAVRWRETARAFLIRYGEPLEGVFAPRPARAEAGRGAARYIIIR